MEKYTGNQEGFIYVACRTSIQKKVLETYIEPLAHDGIKFCWASAFDGRAENNLKKSNALLLFLTKDFAGENKLRMTVDAATKHDKPILTVYLEDVELDPALSMQIESQQALFRDRYENDAEFIEALEKAAIFDDMQITDGQRRYLNRRALLVIIAALAVVLMVVGMVMQSRNKVDLGPTSLSKKDLKSITELYIIGTEVMVVNNEEEYRGADLSNEKDYVHRWFIYDSGYDGDDFDYVDGECNKNEIFVRYGEENETGYSVAKHITIPRGDISDLTVIAQMENLKLLQLDGQQIEDITPLYKLKNLEQLSIACNPVSSFDGIEKMKNLQYLDISCTDISEETDLSVFNKMKSLREIRINSGYEAVWLKDDIVNDNIRVDVD